MSVEIHRLAQPRGRELTTGARLSLSSPLHHRGLPTIAKASNDRETLGSTPNQRRRPYGAMGVFLGDAPPEIGLTR